MATATLQIHRNGQWVDIAFITPRNPDDGHNGPCRLEYDQSYVINYIREHEVAAGVSCRYPVNFDLYDENTWPAFLLDIIPSGAGRDQWIRRLGIQDVMKADWPLLLNGAGSPPGNLRVWESLAGRSETMAVPTAEGINVPLKNHPGFTMEQIISRQEHFIEYAYQNGAQTAGASDVQGAAPKFLLTQDDKGMWHAEGALTDDKVMSHWLVKFPRGKTERDRMVLKNEAAYMSVAKELGLTVFGDLHWEGNTLFIPRFDREVNDDHTITRIGMESLFSLTGVTKYGIEYGGTLSHNQLCKGLLQYTTDPAANLLEYIERDVVNVVLGNKDNHPRNTAVFRYESGLVKLTPLFDFAPMYLDPEGIARNCRWEEDQEAGGKPEWGRVIEAMPDILSAEEARHKLSILGGKIEQLPDTMKTCGVDDEIIEARYYAIRDHSRELVNLKTNTTITLGTNTGMDL